MSMVMHPSFSQYQPISIGHSNSNTDQLPVPHIYSIQNPIAVTDAQYNTISYPSVNLDNVYPKIKSDTGVKIVSNLYNNPNSIGTNKFYNQPVDKVVLPPINTIIKENNCNVIEEVPSVIEGQVKENNNNTGMSIGDTYSKQDILSTNNSVSKNIPTKISPRIQHIKLGSPIQQFSDTTSNTTVNIDNHTHHMNTYIPLQSNVVPYAIPNDIRNSIVSMPQLLTSNLPLQPQPTLQQQQQLQQQQLQQFVPLEQKHQSQIYQPYHIYVPMISTNYQTQQPELAANNGYVLGPPSSITSSLQQQYIPGKVPITLLPMEKYSMINSGVLQNAITVNVPEDNNKVYKDNMKKNNSDNKIVKSKKKSAIKFTDSSMLNGDIKINNDPLDNIASLDTIQTNLNIAKRLRKQCPVCGKICSRPSTLKTHYLIHSGDTPFKCTWEGCTKAFNVKSNMMRHLKSHQKKAQKGLMKK